MKIPEHPDTPGHDDPGEGRRLGIDVGKARIGLALSDRSGIMATPLETVQRLTKGKGPDGDDIIRIVELAKEYEVVEIVVGLPRDLHNNGSMSARDAVGVGTRLRRNLKGIPIRYADERLSTVVATQALQSSGRSASRSRHIIDQAAAVEILQRWLDARQRMLAANEADDATTNLEE